MRKVLNFAVGCAIVIAPAFAAQDVESAVVGSVKTVDRGAKTVVIKTSDGTERTIHYVDKTTVHGGEAVAADAKNDTKESLNGLKEGSDVVVHYTTKGGKDTANEIDHIGKDGLKETQGTIQKFDRGAKTVTVAASDGTVATYRLSDHATREVGKEAANGTEKAGKVTLYYTEEAGHKIAHFFKPQ